MVRIILDTDLSMGEPGSEIDDGFALALAVADPDIQLELITTVNGNSDVETSTRLTGALAGRLGIGDVPIVRGAPAPRHESARSTDSSAAGAEIARRVMAAPGQLTIVAIGPLTNIAAAIELEPAFARNVHEIVVMGGAFLRQGFHSGIPGEFNTWVDPEAARVVLHSGARMRWVGLDVTLRIRLTRERARELARSANPFAAFAGPYAEQWIDNLVARFPGDPEHADSAALHDALAVAVTTHPELVTWRDAYVDVVTGDEVGRGVMVTDLLHAREPRTPNCTIAVDVDVEAATNRILGAIASL